MLLVKASRKVFDVNSRNLPIFSQDKYFGTCFIPIEFCSFVFFMLLSVFWKKELYDSFRFKRGEGQTSQKGGQASHQKIIHKLQLCG